MRGARLEGKTVRNASVEWLRIAMMLMIITLHYFYQGGILETITPDAGIYYYGVWLFEAFCMISVNVYVLISGHYLLEEKFRLKKVVFLVLEVWFYSMSIYMIACLVGREQFNINSILTAYFFPVIKGKWWFITVYIVMYILHPILNIGIKKLTREQHRFLIVILFILFSVIPKIFFFSADQLGLKQGYSLLWFLALYVTGAYSRRYQINITKAKLTLTLCGMITLTALVKIIQVHIIGKEYFNLYSYDSPTVYIASACLFLGVIKFCRGGVLPSIACNIAKSTFGVFIIHTHDSISGWLWNDFIRPSAHVGDVGYLLLSVVGIFIVCIGIDYIRRLVFKPIENGRKLNNFIMCMEKKWFSIYEKESG